MSGNVWEWCQDLYDDYPYGLQTDPLVTTSSRTERVLRGGNWGGVSQDARSARRSMNDPGSGTNTTGFRVIINTGE